MAGGESIYEDGGVGAQGSCEVGEKCLESEALAELMAVSYTHLTLPTIYSV